VTVSDSVETGQLNFVSPRRNDRNASGNRGTGKMYCYGCGARDHVHGDKQCPASDKTCFNCDLKGHFASVCRKTNRQNRQSSSNNWRGQKYNNARAETNAMTMSPTSESVNMNADQVSEEYLFMMGDQHKRSMVCVDNVYLNFIIDSGSTVNIIDQDAFRLLKSSTKLHKTDTKVFTYGAKEPLELAGVFYPTISVDSMKSIAPVLVAVSKSAGCILSEKTSSALGLLEVKESVNVLSESSKEIDLIISSYPEILTGVGKLKDFQLELNIDRDVDPVIQRARPVGFHRRKIIEEELNQLVKDDIIEPVNHATTWSSPIHAEPKSDGKVRLCLDLRAANTAIKRVRHPIPTVEEALERLNGAAVFSKIDLRKGYHQIELAENSRDITTFTSPLGLFRYKRLVFGINCASEQYQKIIADIFNRDRNIVNISDDILVFGKDMEEHNEALKRCLKALSEKGLTINPDKCRWAKEELEFFGFVISKEGVKPTHDKISSINRYPTPTCIKDLRSFLGLINYLNRFIPHLATECEELRKLTRSNTTWRWTVTEEACFQRLKKVVTSSYVMAHFDKNLRTKVVTDASGIGLGAMLLQEHEENNWKVVIYISRGLTDVERRYSQTEREALAIVWAIEKLHIYLYGSHFTVETDHKPLKGIFRPCSDVSARLLRWNLRLQPYTFNIEFIPGTSNPVDGLSRYPVSNEQCKWKDTKTEEFVNFTIAQAVPKAVTLSELLQAAEVDQEMINLKEALMDPRKFNLQNLSAYKLIQTELLCKSGIILRGNRIVVPKPLRERVFQVAHETHLGIEKTKQLLRTKVWWPGVDKYIEDRIKRCDLCLASQPARKPHIRQMTKMPEVWENVNIDICGPLPDGFSLLAIVDQASRWPHVYVIKSTKTQIIIEKLTNLFAILGRPVCIISDNGPQFRAKEFSAFCQEWGVKHQPVTPYHPQSNGEVERFFRTAMKIVKIAMSKQEDWKVPLEKFLLAYRNTPHKTTGVAPAEMLLHRQTMDKLPQLKSEHTVEQHIRDRDARMKAGYEKSAGRSNPNLYVFQPGDVVLVKRIIVRKGDLPFHPGTHKVLSGKYHSYTVLAENGKTYRRHGSHLRLVPSGSFRDQHSETSNIIASPGNQTGYTPRSTKIRVTQPPQFQQQATPQFQQQAIPHLQLQTPPQIQTPQHHVPMAHAHLGVNTPVRSSQRLAEKRSRESAV